MTYAAGATRYQYAGNGVTTAFSFTDLFLANADLKVYLVNNSTGVSTLKTISTHYTVTGAGNINGGTVTMLTAPATGETLIIYRDTLPTQNLDLDNVTKFPRASVEASFDKSQLGLKELLTQIGLAVRSPQSRKGTFDHLLPDPASGVGKVLAVKSDGTAFEWTSLDVTDPLAPTWFANASGGTYGSRRHTLGSSTALAPLSLYCEVPYPSQLRYVFNIQRHDLIDTGGASTLDRALQIDMTRALANDTRVWGIGIIGDDSSDGGKPYVGIYSQMSRQIGGNGNNFAGVFELDDYDGQTDSVAVEINAGIPDGTNYTNASLLHLIVGTHSGEAGIGTLPQAIQINTSGVAGNRKEANLGKAIDIREDGAGRITTGININTSPGAGTGAGYYDTGTKGRGLHLAGTYDLAAIETSGFILKPSLVTVGINNTAWVLCHTDTDRTVELNGGNAINTGGNIRLNGQAHATRPDAVEIRAGNVSQLTVNATGITAAAKVILPATVAGAASLNIPHGTAPSAPSDGDLWTTTAGLFCRANGITVKLGPDTGWSAMTGSGSKAAIAAAAAGTASAAYVQAELQGALNRIAALEARLKALDDHLFACNILKA